jgi:hypothetical protein
MITELQRLWSNLQFTSLNLGEGLFNAAISNESTQSSLESSTVIFLTTAQDTKRLMSMHERLSRYGHFTES